MPRSEREVRLKRINCGRMRSEFIRFLSIKLNILFDTIINTGK